MLFLKILLNCGILLILTSFFVILFVYSLYKCPMTSAISQTGLEKYYKTGKVFSLLFLNREIPPGRVYLEKSFRPGQKSHQHNPSYQCANFSYISSYNVANHLHIRNKKLFWLELHIHTCLDQPGSALGETIRACASSVVYSQSMRFRCWLV